MNRRGICLWAKLTDELVCCKYGSINVTCLFKEVCIEKIKCNKYIYIYIYNEDVSLPSLVSIFSRNSPPKFSCDQQKQENLTRNKWCNFILHHWPVLILLVLHLVLLYFFLLGQVESGVTDMPRFTHLHGVGVENCPVAHRVWLGWDLRYRCNLIKQWTTEKPKYMLQ